MKEKLILLSIGTVATGVMSVVAFLTLSYFGSFITRAEFDNHLIEDTALKTEIRSDLKYIRKDLKELKRTVRGR